MSHAKKVKSLKLHKHGFLK